MNPKSSHRRTANISWPHLGGAPTAQSYNAGVDNALSTTPLLTTLQSITRRSIESARIRRLVPSSARINVGIARAGHNARGHKVVGAVPFVTSGHSDLRDIRSMPDQVKPLRPTPMPHRTALQRQIKEHDGSKGFDQIASISVTIGQLHSAAPKHVSQLRRGDRTESPVAADRNLVPQCLKGRRRLGLVCGTLERQPVAFQGAIDGHRRSETREASAWKGRKGNEARNQQAPKHGDDTQE